MSRFPGMIRLVSFNADGNKDGCAPIIGILKK